jgi:hypothetical protein
MNNMQTKTNNLSIVLVFSLINIMTLPTTVNAQSLDESVLCTNRKYATEFLIQTKRFDAAICSTGYTAKSGCYISTKYFYIGRDRQTGASTILPAVESKSSGDKNKPYVFAYKARKDNYTYQMSTSGGYTNKPWTSLSVFSNSKKIYSEVVNSYHGYLDC